MNMKDKLLIAPLGGLEQIGANCTMIGCNDEWIMVDLGIAFYDKLGIEILTPDISFPESIKKKIKGLFVTHAHEDHIGAIPYLWQRLRCPIYLTEFPAAVLRQKLEDYSWGDEVEIHVVNQRDKVQVGGIEVEYVSLAHSILGACGLYIKTQKGNIFHTGDWKVDEQPLLGDLIDYDRLNEIGHEGVDCLLCDSTNVLVEDEIGSESDVREALEGLISKYSHKRVTVTCFASNVARIETIFNVARKTGRKVAIIGKSMRKMLNAVSETKYFTNKFKENVNLILDDEAAADMPPEKVLLICTGSQGENRSALARLAKGENRVIKLGKNDVVIFSSKVIPGNELEIRSVQNMLTKKEVEIITTENESGIHVSGHPNKDALKKMYKWLNPRSLMPVHGDPRMLYAQRDFAKLNGINEVLIPESGDVISVTDGQLEKVAHQDIVFNAIDGTDLIPIDSMSIQQRTMMSYNGCVCVSFLLEKGRLKNTPEISILGIHIDDSNIKKLKHMISKNISSEINKGADSLSTLKKNCEINIRRLIIRHFEKKPIVVIHILD